MLWIENNSYLVNKFGLRISEIIDINRRIYLSIPEKLEKNLNEFRKLMKEPYQIWKDWKEGRIDKNEMRKKAVKIRNSNELCLKHKKITKDIKLVFTFKIDDLKDVFGKEMIQNYLNLFSKEWGNINHDFQETTKRLMKIIIVILHLTLISSFFFRY